MDQGQHHAGKDRKTRQIMIGGTKVGGDAPVVVQSMCATRTIDVDQTVAQAHQLADAGAGIVRIAMDSEKEIPALKEIRAQTKGIVLSVDLQENYKIADRVAPHVDKIRYNPGHLHHIEKKKSIEQKVKWLVDIARDNDVAIRIGVNCGSVAPAFLDKYPGDQLAAIVESAAFHCDLMDSFGFTRFVVSLKDSEPNKVMDANRRFSERRPDVPLHLGVTEAGLPPDGIIKTRLAFEKLLAQGIGDTIRVSLTPEPNGDRTQEVIVAQEILQTMGLRAFTPMVIACPGCGRTTSTYFQELAQKIQSHIRHRMPEWRKRHTGVEDMSVAVMGCVVNGPGESKHANIGISLPGTGENPVAPVYEDGAKTVTLKGDRIAEEFQELVERYIERTYVKVS